MEATPQRLSQRQFAIVNALISGGVVTFLIWLIYFHQDSGSAGGDSVLPACNALFNSLAAVSLWGARSAIRRGNRRLHQRLIFVALTCSALFLTSYVYYHYSHGDTRFPGTGPIRTAYLALLASHIVTSIVVLPMILSSLYLAFTQRFQQHKRLSRWTWATWMYVSVTGVLTFFMLHVW